MAGRRPLKTPTVLQMEAIECGAAALAIVASYYGLIKPLEHWRTVCGVSRDGVKAPDILKAARTHAMDAKGMKASAADLEALEAPLIIFWEFNHFLVLEGLDAEGAWLNDPATGPRRIDRETFERAYTGIALQVTPGDGFTPEGKPASLYNELADRLKGARLALGLTVLVGFLLTVPNLLVPTFNRVIADFFVLESHPDWYWPLVGSIAAVAAVQALLTWMQSHQLLRLDAKLALVGATGFFWHVLHLPVRYFAQRNASEVGSRVSLNDKVAGVVTTRLAGAALGVLTMIIYAIAMAQYNIGLTLLAIGFAAVNLLVLRFVQKIQVNGNRRLLVEEARYFALASKGLQTAEDLIASGGAERFTDRLMGLQSEVVNQQQWLGHARALLEALPGLLGTLGVVALILVGGLDVMDGTITVGMLIAFQMLMSLFAAPVNQLLSLGQDIQTTVGDMERLDDVMAQKRDDGLTDVPDHEFTLHAERLSGSLEVKDLSFSYSPITPPVLKGINFSAEPGECIALVGASGGGKSTLARLLAGLYQPTSGDILFDGMPQDEIGRHLHLSSLAYVDQEIRLFDGTVADNLTMSDAPVAPQVMIRATKAAAIHDIIMQRPGGLKAKVAADAKNFSGGERQRIEIARALVRSPSILVLDEATSALDADTEIKVIKALTAMGITIILVSHRLSALRHFDRILVLKDGEIADSGSFEILSNRPGPFRDLQGGA